MRIYITGSAGAGKTTYADKLAKELNIQIFRTDDLWLAQEKRMFNLAEIQEIIDIESDWIIEGAYYISEYVRAADKVVYLKISVFKTLFRILKRWFTQLEVREKYSLFSTLKLCYTTVKDMYFASDVDLNTEVASHYKEKDRYNLCKANAKELEVVNI